MARARRTRNAGSRGYERTDRLSELLREVIAEQFDRIDDERLELVTITGVDVDRELERARVFFTCLDTNERAPEVVEALAEHRGRIKRAIGGQTQLRRVPQLVFVPDDTVRGAERIEQIIRDLHHDDDNS